jgi:hypothetical protein
VLNSDGTQLAFLFDEEPGLSARARKLTGSRMLPNLAQTTDIAGIRSIGAGAREDLTK